MPADGEVVVLAKQWPGDVYATEGAIENAKKGWAFIYRNSGGVYSFEFHICYNSGSYKKLWNWNWTLQTNRYYHISMSRGPRSVDYRYMQMNIDKFNINYFGGGASYGYNINVPNAPVIIGQNVDGLVDGMRISVDSNSAYAGRVYWNQYTDLNAFETEEYERMYTYQLYVSDNNINFGHYADVDTYYDNSFSYHTANGVYSAQYYTYFAIDLEQRHKLGLLRTFGDTNNRHVVSLTSNTSYSNVESTDPFDIVMDSTADDARWLIVRLLNGNGTLYTIRSLGLYPDMTESIAPGGDKYNCVWAPFGTSITTFDGANNLALGKPVTASSEFGNMYAANVTNGSLETNLIDVWGTESEASPWLEIDLEEDKQVYRVKIYHGIDGTTATYLINNYTVSYKAEDDTSYTTAFTITGNGSQSRVHDLSVPVTARYIRVNITSYTTLLTTLPVGNSVAFFEGATLREVEVYEYYGFTSINSELYPIITINLRDQFEFTGHTLIGMNAEDTSTDWSNATSNFTYANYVRSDPHKVYFEPWGSDVGYGQWVAIMRNTATDLSSGPDLLKGAIIQADDPRPSEHGWWWQSELSAIDTTYAVPGDYASAGVHIAYPATSGIDHVRLIEGDNFGVDSYLSWRDAFSFNWYIEDISLLDMSYGYMYFGGKDHTPSAYPVLYKWYFSTMSGTLHNGWNSMSLEFRRADEIEYTDAPEGSDDARILDLMTLSSIGVLFKGLGQPFDMSVEGFTIVRNHFNLYTPEMEGLYLTHRDYLSIPMGGFDFTKGTLEFFMKPDYAFTARDSFGKVKNRALFNMSNTANDIFGAMITFRGLEVYYGNLNKDLRTASLDLTTASYLDRFFHIAFVFSSDGSGMGDGSTIKIYVDGGLIGVLHETWVINDSKHFKFIIGGQGPLTLKQGGYIDTHSVDAVLANLKIYNYCKSNFEDSITGTATPRYEQLVSPNQLIEISKDNLTFYKVGDPELPLYFDDVPVDSKIPIYVRSDMPDSMTGREKRTAGLLVSWDIGV